MASFSNIKQVDRQTVTFTLSPLTVTYANALRRLVTSAVETVGFKASIDAKGRTGDVVVKRNDTPMTNEMLAHRIGLIPLAVKDPLSFKPENYKFILNVKNDDDRPRDVTTADFEVFEYPSGVNAEEEQEPIRVATDRFFPANPVTGDHTLIAVIKGKQFGQSTGEAIHLEATPAISNGTFNATFIPTSQCSYEYTRDKNPERIAEVFKKWLSLSKNIKEEEIKEDEARRVALEKEFNTMEVARCYLEDERGEAYSYDFTIETVGILSIGYIVRRACEIGEAMCMRYASIDESDLPEDLTMQRTSASMPGYDFMFKAQGHTLGNLLQTYIVENHIEDEANDLSSVINYAGYCIPHPLHDVMKLTIGTLDDQEVSARKCLAAAARGCAGIFRQLRAEWMKAVSDRGSRTQK